MYCNLDAFEHNKQKVFIRITDDEGNTAWVRITQAKLLTDTIKKLQIDFIDSSAFPKFVQG